MIAQTLEAQITAQSEIDNHGSDRFDSLNDRDFWLALRWEVEAFPERFDLIQQHRDAGLDPRDEKNLDAAPLGSYKRPSTFTSSSGRTVCID